MYHDCQPDGIVFYDYHLICLPDYELYYLKSDVAWTALRLKNLNPKFIKVVEKYSGKYPINNPSMKKMKFEI